MTTINFKQRTRTDWLVVHCSATRAAQDIGATDIRRWHLGRGWADIGYHYVIRRDGGIETGRPEDSAGAHVKGFNSTSVGICLVGGLNTDGKPENNFTPAQFSSLAKLLGQLKRRYPKAHVRGHRDFSPDLNKDGTITPNEFMKVCPCFDVQAWFATNPLG